MREPGRKPQTKSSMWLYCSGSYDKRAIVLFEYQQSKEAKWPKAFLLGYTGYLNVDGASTYEAAQLLATILVGCWSHAKRGFVNALKAAPSGSPTWGTHAYRGQEFCDMLFDLEREYDNLSLTAEERHQQRQLYSRAVLDAFHHWLVTERANVLSKSYTGKAMDYCLRQWPKLTNFLLDGRLEITNNLAERAIKPFVIGRKGWLFSNSTKGAAASVVIYSIIETAKANNLKPFEYLKWLLMQMPNLRLTNDTLQSLLPWSDTIPPECKMNLMEV